MKTNFTLMLLLAVLVGNTFAQQPVSQVCHNENFDTQTSGWVHSLGAKEDNYNNPANNCALDRGIVTPGVGGHDPALVITPNYTSSGALKLIVSFDFFVFDANMNCNTWKDFACPTSIDLFYYANGVKYPAIKDVILPQNGPGHPSKVNIVFGVDANLTAGTVYSVEINFKQKSGIGNCTQSGTKYVIDNFEICEYPCTDCVIDAIDDIFCASTNHPIIVSEDLTTNDSKYAGAKVVYSLANGPFANGNSVVGGANLVVNSNGTFTITRTDFLKTIFEFTYRMRDTILGLEDIAAVRVCFPEGGPLPITVSNLYGIRKNAMVMLNWQAATESNMIDKFEIQRKTGCDFVTVGTVTAGSYVKHFSFNDLNPTTVTTEYRIKSILHSGSLIYSAVYAVSGIDAKNKFDLYPNPSNGSVQIVLSDISNVLNIDLINSNGSKVANILSTENGIIRFSNLKKGIYLITITDKLTGERITKKLVVSK